MIPQTMEAGVLKAPGKLVVEEVPVPEPGPGELLLEVPACGICGSDIRYFHGENPWALHTLGEVRTNPPNMILGHEFAGTVVRAGSKEGEKLLGKRVAAICSKVCGTCPECRGGLENLCRNTIHLGHGAGWGKRDFFPGAYARYTLCWPETCFEVPADFSMEALALMDVLAVGMHAARQAGLGPGKRALIIGAGPVGNAVMQAALALGSVEVSVADTDPKARAVARECGATRVLNPKEESVSSLAQGAKRHHGLDAVVDTVGSPDSFQLSLAVLAPGGSAVLMAVHEGEGRFPTTALGGERKIMTSCNFRTADFELALKLLLAGKLDPLPWISHRLPLSGLPGAMKMLEEKEKQGAFKILIQT